MSEYDILNKNCCHFCEDPALCHVVAGDAFSICHEALAAIICYVLCYS